MITMRPSDFYIADVDQDDGTTVEVVRIKGQLAFDEGFIEEMKNQGVRRWNKDNSSKEEEKTEE